MEIMTTSEIQGMIEGNRDKFFDKGGDWTPYAENMMSQKWCSITELKKEMQSIIDDEKKRCGEANAVTCWTQLKQILKQGV